MLGEQRPMMALARLKIECSRITYACGFFIHVHTETFNPIGSGIFQKNNDEIENKKKKLFSDMIYNNHSMVVDVFLIYDPVAPYIKK